MNVSLIPKYKFVEYREELCECHSGEYYEIGKITIKEEDIYASLHDEFLNEEEYINRLVKSGDNFFNELEKIKKECLEYLVKTAIIQIKQDLNTFKFE